MILILIKIIYSNKKEVGIGSDPVTEGIYMAFLTVPNAKLLKRLLFLFSVILYLVPTITLQTPFLPGSMFPPLLNP